MEWIKIADELPPIEKGVLVFLVTKLPGIEKPHYWATFGRLTFEKGLSIPEIKTGYISDYETVLAWAQIPLPDRPERLNGRTSDKEDAKV